MDTARLLPAMNRADVGVVEQGEQPRLAREARQRITVALDLRREHFQGDVAAKVRVAGAIDFAHPASSERANDLVRAEPRPGTQGHRVIRSLGARGSAAQEYLALAPICAAGRSGRRSARGGRAARSSERLTERKPGHVGHTQACPHGITMNVAIHDQPAIRLL